MVGLDVLRVETDGIPPTTGDERKGPPSPSTTVLLEPEV